MFRCSVLLSAVLLPVGFAELEYGMLRLMGAIDDDTPVLRQIRNSERSGELVLIFLNFLNLFEYEPSRPWTQSGSHSYGDASGCELYS